MLRFVKCDVVVIDAAEEAGARDVASCGMGGGTAGVAIARVLGVDEDVFEESRYFDGVRDEEDEEEEEGRASFVTSLTFGAER